MLDRDLLPARSALARVAAGGRAVLAHWDGAALRDLRGLTLDALLALPAALIPEAVEQSLGAELDPERVELLAPCESQEVWAAGVTYARSRSARMEEAQQSDIYARVYEAERPELFFKSSGWRVVPPGGEAAIRGDSTWDVPEPELAVLTNARGEPVAWTAANDMSSRSIEGENPLYLPQAKVYDRACSLGPVAVFATADEMADVEIRMEIERDGARVFEGTARTSQLVREPAAMAGVLHSSYPLPQGAWLMTGTGIVPPPPYTAEAGDLVRISIDGVGTLVNRLVRLPQTGARAQPRA
jgi:2-dehydro-3-deoxy-D-arabinonate dehydratase